MLNVGLHFCRPGDETPFNQIGSLDIACEKAGGLATYKACLASEGFGGVAPVTLSDYPRWGASVWDLVARCICLSISHQESIWPAAIPEERRGAYITNLSAVVWRPALDEGATAIAVGRAHVQMCKRRCNYQAMFHDDLTGERRTEVFRHTPVALIPWDLLVRAYGWAFNAEPSLPARPQFRLPKMVEVGGGKWVQIADISEPMLTALRRWLGRRQAFSTEVFDGYGECVSGQQFSSFLATP